MTNITERTNYTSPSALMVCKEGIVNDIKFLKKHSNQEELRDLIQMVLERKEGMLKLFPKDNTGIERIPVSGTRGNYSTYGSSDLDTSMITAGNFYEKEQHNRDYISKCLNENGVPKAFNEVFKSLYDEITALIQVLEKSKTTGNIR